MEIHQETDLELILSIVCNTRLKNSVANATLFNRVSLFSSGNAEVISIYWKII